MRRSWLALAILATLLAAEALAQYPGQYPPGGYPPGGGYPGGQYPQQQTGPGIPWPRKKKKTANGKDAEDANLQQIKGTLRQLNARTIVMTADDSRNIEFRYADTTKFLNKGEPMKSALLRPGDHIMIEANQDDEGYFYAVRVNFEKEGSMQDREKASVPVQVSIKTPPPGQEDRDDPDRPVMRRADSKPKDPAVEPKAPPAVDETKPTAAQPEPTPPPEPSDKADLPVVESNVAIDASDPGAPKLRRGGPSRTHKPAPVEVAANTPPSAGTGTASPPAPDAPAPSVDTGYQSDPRVEKARAAAEMFTESLPAYVCQQQIARFQSTTHKVSWQAVDLVSAEVVYENQKEQYRNLAINGKPVKKRMEDLEGSWSTGEFGTILRDLYSHATAADFRYRRQTRMAGRDAYMFDYEVDRENSHWHVEVASQSIRPAYRGSVWIDKETAQTLRIEMEAVQLPKAFPTDKLESAVDYQFIRIGERNYLLPVHSEVLSCQRGTSNCSRNVIDFRNYHKYAGESTITFEPK